VLEIANRKDNSYVILSHVAAYSLENGKTYSAIFTKWTHIDFSKQEQPPLYEITFNPDATALMYYDFVFGVRGSNPTDVLRDFIVKLRVRAMIPLIDPSLLTLYLGDKSLDL
jgi:hypothetical protein